MRPTDWMAAGSSVTPPTFLPMRLAVKEARGSSNVWRAPGEGEGEGEG